MADGKVTLDTELDKSGAQRGMASLNNDAKSAFGGMASMAIGAVAAIGAAGVGATLAYTGQMEQLQTSFSVMTGSSEKAAEVMDRLKTLGAQTPFETKDLAESTQLLMNYGFSADDAITNMTMLGDISQGSAEKMKGIATPYGQMHSANKVQLEDVKQMIENGFNPLQEISRTTGESMDSLYDRISKGTVSVDEITGAMQSATAEGGKYFGSMDAQSKTMMGQFSTLKDNVMQSLSGLFQPLSDDITNIALPAINNFISGINMDEVKANVQGFFDVFKGAFAWIQENSGWIAPIAVGIGAIVAAMTIWNALQVVAATVSSVMAAAEIVHIALTEGRTVAQIVLNSAVAGGTISTNAAAAAQWLLNAAMEANPIGIIILAVIALVAAFIYLWNTNEDFRNALISAWDAIVGAFNYAGAAIGQFFSEIGAAFGQMGDAAGNAVNDVINWFMGLPGAIWGAISGIGNMLFDAGANIIDGFLNGLRDKFNDVMSFITWIATWIAEHKGPKSYDLALLVPAGGWIMTGLVNGLKKSMPMLKATLGNVSGMITDGIMGTGINSSLVGSTVAGSSIVGGSAYYTSNNGGKLDALTQAVSSLQSNLGSIISDNTPDSLKVNQREFARLVNA